jgi:polysaccharide pyruvyl transferase WcaK-like protein
MIIFDVLFSKIRLRYIKMNEENVLVLGFYNRKNTGDDAYTIALPLIFNEAKRITFVSMDDALEIPADVDVVVCGGGDIINDYFMNKAQNLLKTFKGRVYAVSVGIPFADSTKYLHLFDHVFVRSTTDYELAIKEIGIKNVTYCPDAAVSIPVRKKVISTNESVIRIGVCLAQPAFYNNPKKSTLTNSFINAIINLRDTLHMNIELHMVAFNYSDNNRESDHIINDFIAKLLRPYGIICIVYDSISSPVEMLDLFSDKIDVAICMRYHSVVFSLLTNTPFIALYSSSKVDNLIKDCKYDNNLVCKLPVDRQYRPTSIDETLLYNSLVYLCNNKYMNFSFDLTIFKNIQDVILQEKKTTDILVSHYIRSFEDVLLSCRWKLSKYMQFDVGIYDNMLYQHRPFPLGNKTAIEVARYICFIISEQIHHSCLWGLAENLEKEYFCLYEAIDFVWKYTKTKEETDYIKEVYYPKSKNFQRRMLLNLDFVFQNDFSQYHRSGWGYVVGALMNIDAPRIMRSSDILLDTYVDRSFHWGFDILNSTGVLPYKQPWYGFIHHTFDTKHSEYNCYELFKNPIFIESLQFCKGLLALSNYLAIQLRETIKNLSLNVPVYVLYHPMEFVDNKFTITKFLDNPNKSVVQIGAWLRNPYALYELPLPPEANLKKVALKGKEMDMYFSPPDFLDVMEETLLRRDWYQKQNLNATTGNVSICRPICRPTGDNCANSVNKYCQGLYDTIVKNSESVIILDKLSNEDYDKLLSENIVFLNLVDCSAVNTVIECIVRNTVLIVNRLPPLEEILGVNYPGFYTTLQEAASLCTNINDITQIHNYMNLLDKKRYELEFFVQHIQDIMLSDGKEEFNYTYDLFSKPSSLINNIFQVKYSTLLKYLPATFSTTFSV